MKLFKLIGNKNYIGGKWIESVNQAKVLNPAVHDIIGYVPSLNEEEVKSAVNNTVESFDIWSKVHLNDRAEFLKKMARAD